MGKLSDNQRGFSAIEAAVIIIIFGLLGFVGWRVYGAHTKASTTPNTPVAQLPTTKGVDGQVVTANNNFGLNVFNYLTQQSRHNNIFISPASIAMALSMVYNGAAGSSQTAIQQTLHYQGLKLATINSSNSALITSLKNPDPTVSLAIANSTWLRQGVAIKQDFLNVVQKNYQAQASTLNFSDPAALNTINGWVSTATHGKIPTIIDHIPPAEIMYLINAVYFNGQWHTKFDPSQTQDQVFTTGAGSTVQIPLMSQNSKYNYYQGKTVQAIQLPYGKNQRLSMNVYLPVDMNAFLNSLNYNQLASLNSKFSRQTGSIDLPKFTLDYSQNLNNALKALGMSVAFDPSSANFDKIASGAYISDVEHKTYIGVTEQGTEAAAATSVGVADSAAVASQGFDMRVDKPFVFTIQDNASRDILFVGVIQDPSK